MWKNCIQSHLKWHAVSFKLRTEVLAEKRRQQHEEKEVAHLRHTQQRILGRKTVEDFAQLKLMRRETAATRSRSLHCNGNTSTIKIPLESRPLMSARLSTTELISNSLPRRPQSAKPVLQSQYRSMVGHSTGLGNDKEIELLDEKRAKTRCAPSTKKKKRKKASARKAEGLTPSKSAPILPDSQNMPTCKKINIVVNMRNLQLLEEPESPVIVVPSVISREAWGDV
ncbi:hypothetical protein PHPALM_29891 [Phytophthora palmivora]|uniref:Uncharacterized protein n=1 Tax=Phytophthora palmivora TaxID=4796 RepID=A0A2P4X6G6_9STRA|nr:hypothetical protein PHPALM_29891 [Phytophthora palmivora]